MLSAPEWSQHPTRSFGVFPTCHGAPNTRRRKVYVFIADQGRCEERVAMIVAPDRRGVHQENAAFFTRVDHQFLALKREDGWRYLHVEIAGVEPLGIGRSKVV